uniref:FtsJ-like methyltransferase n=1 Tax=Pithovirus LCPAC001 TaxID=2506585 RepID=A0A481Z1S1_9VIRU|nr:MAG: FtsJ-like methyltransferase [Pithovirus LCPAC001]
MDPVIPMCKLWSSFKKEKIVYKSPVPYKTSKIEPTAYDLVDSNPNEYIKPDIYNQYLLELDNHGNPLKPEIFKDLEKKANPFESIGTSIFIDRSSVELANLDAIFKLTKPFLGLLGTVLSPDIRGGQDFIFCVLNSVSGGFTQYIQYRKKRTIGFGMSPKPKNDSGNPNRNVIETNGINIFHIELGSDLSGNVCTNGNGLSKKILKYHPYGLDLVVAGGMFDYDDHRQRNFKMLVCEILVALKSLSKTGKFACKIYDSIEPVMVELLYIVATCFEKFYIIKPASTRPSSSNRYIIGVSLRKGEIDTQIKILNDLASTDEVPKHIIIYNQIDSKFVKYIYKNNNEVMSNQIKYLKIINSEQIHYNKEYNLVRFSYLWDIPS